jgi:cardiolipin synthase
MIKSIKKILPVAITTAMFLLNSCSHSPDLNMIDLNEQQIQAQSLEGKVPANGDINIMLDNKILARRTFNNAPAKFYMDGVQAFPAMERFIDSAKKSLYVETFIFRDDLTGRKIAEKLVAKKRQGVDVKILVDMMGLKDQKADQRIFDYLVSQQMDIKKYNKAGLSLTGVNVTHRKILLADGSKAISGGMNFANEYENVWHDSMFEVQGEVAQDIQKEFFYDWTRAGGKMPAVIPSLEPGVTYGNIPMRVLVTSAPEKNKRYSLKNALLTMIDNAKSRVRLESPYLSDSDLILHLALARQKGIQIDTIVPKDNDVKVFNLINLGNIKTLNKNGVDVYMYQPRFSHVKAAVIDNMAILGSANLDRRSFEENQELNVVIEDPAFVNDVNTRLFDNDISQARIENLSALDTSFLKTIAIGLTDLVAYYL